MIRQVCVTGPLLKGRSKTSSITSWDGEVQKCQAGENTKGLLQVCVRAQAFVLTCVLISHFSEAFPESFSQNEATWFCLSISHCQFVMASVMFFFSFPCLCICCLGCVCVRAHTHTLSWLIDFLGFRPCFSSQKPSLTSINQEVT